jgi:transposase
VAAGEVRRARVVLLIADGRSLKETAEKTGFTVRNARKWIWRFIEKRLAGLKEKPRPGRKPLFPPQSDGGGHQASL